MIRAVSAVPRPGSCAIHNWHALVHAALTCAKAFAGASRQALEFERNQTVGAYLRQAKDVAHLVGGLAGCA